MTVLYVFSVSKGMEKDTRREKKKSSERGREREKGERKERVREKREKIFVMQENYLLGNFSIGK